MLFFSRSAVRRTSHQIDLPRLREATAEVLKKYPLSHQLRQICFHTNNPADQNVLTGVGSFYDKKTNSLTASDFDFNILIDEFKGTYFEELNQYLNEELPGGAYRMRFMFIPPQTCYSFHYDLSYRYHIAVHTSPSAFLVFKDEAPIHIPPDGHIYRTNTLRWHTAMNCSEQGRLHLVVCSKK